MELEKLFENLEGLKERASVKAAFGEPQTIGEKTIIPIAQAGYGLGMGFGEGKALEEEETPTRCGGGGGGASAKPIAVLEVTPETTKVTPILD